MIGTVDPKKDTLSNFAPPQQVRELTALVRQDYENGYHTLHTPFTEFDDVDLITRQDENQKLFNSYISPASINPDEKWHANVVRPFVRNQVISMASHLTANILFPNAFAQNNQDEEDRDAANIMRDMILWNVENSDYELSYFYTIFGMLINPVAYMRVSFDEIMQTVKERTLTGEIGRKDILDEVLSGMQFANVPAEEIMLPNAYEFNIQRQKSIARQRFVDYDELEARYGNHENFEHVRPGIKTVFYEADESFYDLKDDELGTLGEEVIYYNRREDAEVAYVNGIYLGDSNVENNQIRHRDNRNAPKYEYVKTGFEPIDERRFFAYKSLVSKLQPEADTLNRTWRTALNASFLNAIPPTTSSGSGKINTAVMIPGVHTSLPEDTEVKVLTNGINPSAAFNAVNELERSLIESSQDPLRRGVSGTGSQTAFEISRLEQNARINLGPASRQIFQLVHDVGNLMVDNILHYQTSGEVEQILGGNVRLKYRNYILADQPEGGQTVSKIIRFTDEMIGFTLKEDEIEERQRALFEEEGGLDASRRIYLVNPYQFSRLRFSIRIDPDALLPKNEQFEKALKLEGYDRMIINPHADTESVSRDFLFDVYARGESSKYMRRQPVQPPVAQAPEAPQEGQTANLVEQLTGTNSLVDLVRS